MYATAVAIRIKDSRDPQDPTAKQKIRIRDPQEAVTKQKLQILAPQMPRWNKKIQDPRILRQNEL